MIISEDYGGKLTIRNRSDLSVIKTIKHNYGYLYCGLYFPEQKVVMLGMSKSLVEFDF